MVIILIIKKPWNKPSNEFSGNYLKTNNLINNVGQNTGFIGNNYASITNSKVLQINNFTFPLTKLIKSNSKFTINFIARNFISDHNFVGMDIQNNIRIGHWNTMNFDLLSNASINYMKTWSNLTNIPDFSNNNASKDAVHAFFIASLINEMKFDIIGLTEINASVTSENATNFRTLLNKLSPNNNYDVILSNELKGKTITGSGQIEKVCIIYNKNEIENVQTNVYSNPVFKYNKSTKTFSKYTGTLPSNPDISLYYDYVRPPFMVTFNPVVNKPLKIGVAYSHNDSPGKSKLEIDSKINGLGNKEYFEALQTQSVLNEIKTVLLAKPIYMGDTNIPTGKQTNAFASIGPQYNFAFLDKKEYNTSLGTEKTANLAIAEINKINSSLINDYLSKQTKIEIKKQLNRLYANAYDKIIYDNDLLVQKFNDPTRISTFNDVELSENYLILYKEKYLLILPASLPLMKNKNELY